KQADRSILIGQVKTTEGEWVPLSTYEDRPNEVDVRVMYEGRPPWDVALDLIAQVEATEGGKAEWAKLREWCELWRRWPLTPSDPQQPPQRPPPRQRGPRQLEAFWLAVHDVVGYARAHHVGWDGRPDGYVSRQRVLDILRELGWAVPERKSPQKL